MSFLPRRASLRLLPIVLALAAPACLGGTGFLSFPITEPIDEQVVNGNPFPTGPFGNAFQIPMNVDLSAEAEAHKTGPAQHVHLTSLVLDVTTTKEPSGDTDDFDFLDSVEVFIESTKSGSTLPRVRVAHIDPVPTGVRQVSFAIDDVDVIDYVREGSRLTTEAHGSFPPDDVSFDGEVKLSIEVL